MFTHSESIPPVVPPDTQTSINALFGSGIIGITIISNTNISIIIIAAESSRRASGDPGSARQQIVPCIV